MKGRWLGRGLVLEMGSGVGVGLGLGLRQEPGEGWD